MLAWLNTACLIVGMVGVAMIFVWVRYCHIAQISRHSPFFRARLFADCSGGHTSQP
jgi:hypothetical protein